MPPRKSTSTSSSSVPKPNDSHPSAALIPIALLGGGGGGGRPHPDSYHAFIVSDADADAGTKSSSSKLGPAKKRVKLSSSSSSPSTASPRVLNVKLLRWYDGVKDLRGMPWRKEQAVVVVDDDDESGRQAKTQRGYEVWVSEIMLQQTQVATVKAYYTAWMDAFPTVAALATADPEQVNARWKGLGYYSRATRLHKGAQKVMNDFNGVMPETAKELEKIDGIGPYSAGAISSIAFGRRAAMVDGNVTRVLSRLTAFHAPATAKATTNYIWALADLLVPSNKVKGNDEEHIAVGGPNKSGAWNQALMELGATVCTPKSPRCGECPLSEECLAYAEVRFAADQRSNSAAAQTATTSADDIEDLCTLCSPIDNFALAEHAVTAYPAAKERKKPREEETAVCVLEWLPSAGSDSASLSAKRKVLLVKRPEKGLLAGLFEFPAIDLPASDEPLTSAARRKKLLKLVKSLIADTISLDTDSNVGGLHIHSETPLPPVTQVYSHQIRTYTPLRVTLTSPTLPRLAKGLTATTKWLDEADVEGANVGGAVSKIWVERDRQTKGLGPSTKGAGWKKPGSSKANAKANANAKPGSTLDGWVRSSQSAGAGVSASASASGESKTKTKTKRMMKNGYETGSDEDVSVEAQEQEEDFKPSANYKKRTIVISDDEEDE